MNFNMEDFNLEDFNMGFEDIDSGVEHEVSDSDSELIEDNSINIEQIPQVANDEDIVDDGICNSTECNNRSYVLCNNEPYSYKIEEIHPYLLENYEFENKRKTMKPGPKSKTRCILTLSEMIKQVNDDGINPLNCRPKDGYWFVDSIYIHPNLLKFFHFEYTRKTNRLGPKSKTLYPLTMLEKYTQIVKAGINPKNGHFITDYSTIDDPKYIDPYLVKYFPFNRTRLTADLQPTPPSMREMYRQILNAGINPFTGHYFNGKKYIKNDNQDSRNDDANYEDVDTDCDSDD